VPVPVRSDFSVPFFSTCSIRSRYWRMDSENFCVEGKPLQPFYL
jgi:hypothetical protein